MKLWHAMISLVTLVALISACSSSSESEDIKQQGDMAQAQDSIEDEDLGDQADVLDQGDLTGTQDTEQAEDTVVDPTESMLIFRLEVRHGSMDKIRGLTLLTPSGLLHNESEGNPGCAGPALEGYVIQLQEAVAAANPWEWGEAGRTGEDCGTSSLKYILHLEDMSQGKVLDSNWCGPDEGALDGRQEMMKKIQKLNAWIEQNGVCDIMPRVLGTPVAAASGGYTDPTGLSVAVARFEDPAYCLINYMTISGELYRTNTNISLDQTTANSIAAGLSLGAPENYPEIITPICPEAASILFDPALLGNNGQEALTVIVGPGPEGIWDTWLATAGVTTYISPTEEAPDHHTVRFNNMTFYKATAIGTPEGKVPVSTWYETTVQSTAFEYDWTIVAPEGR
jgi:hypothetical protein